jgi:hypothetical protein
MSQKKNLLSNNRIRNKLYQLFLSACFENKKTIDHIVRLGERLLFWSGVHPHYFGDNTLRYTAEFLTFYALQLPHEYSNRAYRKIRLSVESAKKIIALFERRIAQRMPVEYITYRIYYIRGELFRTLISCQ